MDINLFPTNYGTKYICCYKIWNEAEGWLRAQKPTTWQVAATACQHTHTQIHQHIEYSFLHAQ